MDISGEFSEIILQYNKNIQVYNDNMRLYLDVIRINSSINRTNQNVHPLPARRTNNIFESLFSTNTPFRNIVSLQNTVLHEDVVIAPTEEQISDATEIIRFNENISINACCPITLDPFIQGERVCRIKHCSHLFKENSLRDWFRRNVRCPVCRYDIREYGNGNGNSNGVDDDDEDSDNEYSDLVNELLNENMNENAQTTHNEIHNNTPDNNLDNATQDAQNAQSRNISNVTNVIRDFINNELLNSPNLTASTSELLYAFDIPLTSLDASGSYRRYF